MPFPLPTKLALPALVAAVLAGCGVGPAPLAPPAGLKAAHQGPAFHVDRKQNGWGIGDEFIVDRDPPAPADAIITTVGTDPAYAFQGGARAATHYTVAIGESTVDVWIPTDRKGLAAAPERFLQRFAGYYALIPPANRRLLRTFDIDPGFSPYDEQFRKEYNWPEGVFSAATSGDGRTSYFGGGKYLSRENFQHEFGHNVAWLLAPGCYYAPPGWLEAIEGDHDNLGQYASSNAAEDFATSYRAYLEAKKAGKAKLGKFVARFPRRAALLERITQGKALEAGRCE